MRRASVLALTLALLTGGPSAEAQETVAIRAARMVDVTDMHTHLGSVGFADVSLHWVVLGGEVARERAR